MTNNIRKTKKLIKKVSKSNKTIIAIIISAILVCTIIGAFYIYKNNFVDNNTHGDFSVHFLELGNVYAGDCIYIKCGDNDILVDAGSRTGSVSTIDNYIKKYVKDNILEYVIVTHADQDHIAGFAGTSSSDGIFDLYECKTIIDFPLTNKTTAVYNRYIEKRDTEILNGATRFSALDCINQTNGALTTYSLGINMSLTILNSHYYTHTNSDENNYSVCFLLKIGAKNLLFTGDLEESGEQKLVELNDLPKVDLFKAGHHGSKTSSNEVLLEVIQPKIVVATCVAGSVEYTQEFANTFPTQSFIDRVSKYTKNVYVTSKANVEYDNETSKYKNNDFESFNGNIVITMDTDLVVNCSNNNTKLYQSSWFITNRTMPSYWAS